MSATETARETGEARPAGRRRLLGPAFWAAVAFGLVCALVGGALGVWGARTFPATVGVPLAAPAVQPVAAVPSPPPPAPAPPAPAPEIQADTATLQPALGALDDRLRRTEQQHKATVDAAAAALAVAALSQAAETSRPFGAELEAAARLLPSSADLTALRIAAAAGAPARSALLSDFDAVAARAAVASRAPAEGSGPLTRIAAALAGMVTVRRVDRITGSDPDAVLARAERRLAEGDLIRAVKELDALPPRGRAAVASWRAGAERRLEIERRLANLRTSALQRLADAGAGA